MDELRGRDKEKKWREYFLNELLLHPRRCSPFRFLLSIYGYSPFFFFNLLPASLNLLIPLFFVIPPSSPLLLH